MPSAQVQSGANLGFKVGLQSAIDAIIAAGSGAQHGTFYLAKDTHRLYIGNEDTSLSPVNEGIVSVANLSSLSPEMGHFAYVTSSNILCVYSGGRWVQINPDTNTEVTAVTQTMSDSSGTTSVTTTLTNTLDGGTVSSPQDVIKFTGAGGAKVASDSTGTDPVLTVTGEQYTVSSSVSNGNVATVTLGPSAASASAGWSDSSTVTIKGGNNVSIAAGTTSDIEISAVDTINSVKSATLDPVANNGNGFVLTVTTEDGQSALNDVTKTDTIDPVISYGDSNTPDAHFVGGTATLDVYSKTEIDNKFKGLDAMHYMGTMGNGGQVLNQNSIDVSAIPSTGTGAVQFKVGDTYKLAGQTTIENANPATNPAAIVYPANTIVIANGTEGSDGYITPASLHFDIITGSSETDSVYHFNSATTTRGTGVAAEAGVQLANQNDSASGELRIKEGTAVEISNVWDSTNHKQTVTVNHADVSSSTTAGTAITQKTAAAGQNGEATDQVSVVTGVTVNSQGHVTGVEKTNVTLTDTNLNLASLASGVSVSNGKASITDTLSYNHPGDNTNSTVSNSSHPVTIDSDNLTITADGSYGIKINLVWGSM